MTLVEIPARPAAIGATAEDWAQRIRAEMSKTVVAIVGTGRRIIECKAELPHGQFEDAVRLAGISDSTAARLMAIARHPVISNPARAQDLPPAWGSLYELTKVEPKLLEIAIERGEITPDTTRDSAIKWVSPKEFRIAHNSGEFDWYIPAHVVELARKVMGGIELDPASSREANTVVKAERFFSAEDDGLTKPWAGRLWMNPPYVNKTITAFAQKLVQHYEAGDVPAAVVLSNNATDTAWFHQLLDTAAALCLLRGRLRFWKPGGESPAGAALQGQVVFYLGGKPNEFAEIFGTIGKAMFP